MTESLLIILLTLTTASLAVLLCIFITAALEYAHKVWKEWRY